jgi:hypothetical protein
MFGIPITFLGAYLLIDGGMRAATLNEKFAALGIPAWATKILRLGLIISLAGCIFLMCPLAYFTFIFGIPTLLLGLPIFVLGAATCAAPVLAGWIEKQRQRGA